MDRILEITGWTLLVIFWALSIKNFLISPEKVPTHFNIRGEADAYGGRINILILPAIAAVLYTGMTLLNRFPHIFNYMVSITEENALRQYTNSTRMIRVLKLVLVIVFLFIGFQMHEGAGVSQTGFGSWVMPVIMLMVFVPIVYFIVRSLRMK